MPPLKVKAGNRALETAREVVNFRDPGHGGNFICFCAECEDSRAALIQSAMNAQRDEISAEYQQELFHVESALEAKSAQERELREALGDLFRLANSFHMYLYDHEQLEEMRPKIERLLAVRNEVGREHTGNE